MVSTAVVVLLSIHAALVCYSSRRNFVAIDELGHFAAAVSYWDTGRFFVYRVNPPLPRVLAAVPLLPDWPKTDYRQMKDYPGSRAEFAVGRDLAVANPETYFDHVCRARLAGVVWSVLGGWIIFRWARDLYGAGAGILGLILWCFGANVIAFAQLLVPDVPAAVAGLTACYVYWRYLREPSWDLAYFAGLLLGIAELTKYTALIFYGVWPLLGLAQRWRMTSDQRRRFSGKAQTVQGLAMAALSLLVINLGYNFEDTLKPLGEYAFVSRSFGGELPAGAVEFNAGLYGNRFHDTWLENVPVPLPANYVLGIDTQRHDFEIGFPSYLRGVWHEQGEGGWWYYYLYALAVKVPLGAWALVLWGLVLTLRRHPSSASWFDEWCLWLPVAVILGFVSSQTGFNHHMRYILPIFPFAIVSTGKLAWFWDRGRWKAGAIVAALVIWFVASSLSVYPHSMSYFNEAAGGPDNGSAHLVDSNIDWGQDLLNLKRWLDQHPEAQPLHLAYFGLIDPRSVGIEFAPVPPGGEGPRPGYYAVSANFVRGIEFPSPDGKGGLHFNSLREHVYFQRFRPIARAGYSIFIYHITLNEANDERRLLGLPDLAPDIEEKGGRT